MKMNSKISNTYLLSISVLFYVLVSCQYLDSDFKMKESRYKNSNKRDDSSINELQFESFKIDRTIAREKGEQHKEESSCWADLLKKCCFCLLYESPEEDYESEHDEMEDNEVIMGKATNDPFINIISDLGEEELYGMDYFIKTDSENFTKFTVNRITNNPFSRESEVLDMTYSTILNPFPSYIKSLGCIPREAWGRSPYHTDKELVNTNRFLYIPIHSELTLSELAANSQLASVNNPNNKKQLRNIYDLENSEYIPEGKIMKMEDIKISNPAESPKFLDGPLDWIKYKVSKIGSDENEKNVEISSIVNKDISELYKEKKITFKFAHNSGLTEEIINQSIKGKVPYWISYTKAPLPKNTILKYNDMYPTILEAMFILANNTQMKKPILTCAETSTTNTVGLVAIYFDKKEREYEFITVNPNNPKNVHVIAVNQILVNPTSPACFGCCEMPRFCCGQGFVRLDKCYFCSLPATCTCCNKKIKCCNCGIPNFACCICCCCPTVSGYCIYPTSTTYYERCKCCSASEVCFCCSCCRNIS
jgi:hypothetical protein